MTFWDFLHQAGFWQWFGIIMLAHAITPIFTIKWSSRADKKATP